MGREAESKEEERKGVDAIDYFGNVLFIVQIGGLEEEYLVWTSAR